MSDPATRTADREPSRARRAHAPAADTESFRGIRCIVLDLDGVVMTTAGLHLEAWQRAFDELRRALGREREIAPLSREDYRRLLDGKPRAAGARSLLADRGIELPRGGDRLDRQGGPTLASFCDRKNALYGELLARAAARRDEPAVFPDALARVREWRARGLPVAIATASRNGRRVLEAAGLSAVFDAVVDGNDLDALGRTGSGRADGVGAKAALLAEAAHRLGRRPSEALVVEDAAAGIEAARAAAFGVVVGVDREAEGHLGEGADLVVTELTEILLPDRGLPRRWRALDEVPPFEQRREELLARLAGYREVVFLDFDGTLSSIVDDPAEARLHPQASHALRRLAERCPVAIISGRDRSDLARRVRLDGVWLAGSHGLDISGPDGRRFEPQGARGFLPELDSAEAELRARLGGIAGALIERKRYAVAVHDRRVDDPAGRERIERAVAETAAAHESLRRSEGKRVHELRPRLDWDKGKALRWLLGTALDLGDDPRTVPIYVGDDVTDEDAFEAVGERGIGLVVDCAAEQTLADYQVIGGPGAVARLLYALLPGQVDLVLPDEPIPPDQE